VCAGGGKVALHELSVTQSLLGIAVDHARKAGARRVTELRIVIGQLSSIVDDSVQFYWDLIAKGTPCEGARLVFDRVPARFRCLDCGTEYVLSGDLAACPGCGEGRIDIVAGTEFRLDSIVVEDQDEGIAGGEKEEAKA
jgi:hydrogenase nickel incorporation protein HypA/HybF